MDNFPEVECSIQGCRPVELDIVIILGMYRIRIPVLVSGKIPLPGKILPDNTLVFEIGETGVKTLE